MNACDELKNTWPLCPGGDAVKKKKKIGELNLAKIKGRPRAAEGCCPLPGGSSEKDADLGDAGARVAFHSVPVGPDEAQRGGGMVGGFGDSVLIQSGEAGACGEFHPGACMQPKRYILTSPVTT